MSDRHRPKHVSSFLIWGGWYGSRNIGDDAILLGLKELIQRVNRGRDFYIRALTTDADQTASLGVTGEPALVKHEAIKPWAWLRVLRSFARADRVIVSGGTPVFDSSHAIRTLYLALPLALRTPFVVFGAGVKPLKSAYGRRAVPALLRRARYISVRDDDSQRILTELGVPDVHLTADSAFFAQPATPAAVTQLLTEYAVGDDESLLVVSPRLLSPERKRLYLQEEMGDALIRETPARIAHAIDRLAPKFGRVIVMAMHFHGPDSDVPIIREIMARVRARNVVVIDRELTPDVAIALFKRARLVLAVRLHALLLSASMGTPIVGVAYEQKVRSLFGVLGVDEYCHDLFTLNPDALAASGERALENERALREHLGRRVDALRERVMASAEVALRLPSP
jgi:polysaccharide pyruvyl transferase WcaK-like protein